MHRAVMPPTERDCELIADLAPKRARLGASEVVGIRGLAAAEETRLLGDIAQMLPAAIATWRREREDALVDAVCLTRAGTFARNGLLRPGNLSRRRSIGWQCKRIGCWQL